MRAYVYERYGPPDVLELREVEKPRPTGEEVLVKIHAASVNAYDWHLMRADPFLVRIGGMGFFRPKNPRLGADIAGTVEAVGDGVTELAPGDEVFGSLSRTGNGGFAEFAVARAEYLAPLPEGLSFEEAAALPMAGNTALQGLRDVLKVGPGCHVAINGASGGVGTFAVQIAKALGAEVTAVCSTQKLEQARSLGSDHVIDYKERDFTAGTDRYDAIFGVNGYQSLRSYRRALKPNGTYAMAGGSTRQILQGAMRAPLMPKRNGKTMTSVSEKPNKRDLVALKELVESGAVRPVIDKVFPLERVPDAIRYLEEGHAAGKVVVTVGSGG